MDSDRFTAALGPVWSNNGTRTWNLLLAPDRIIAWPYTFLESFTFALRIQLMFWPQDPGAAFRSLGREGGVYESGLPRTRTVRRSHVHLLRSIVIRSNNTANTSTFEKFSGEADEYTIAVRQEPDEYRAVLGELCSGKYQEKDFPTSAIGRLLRKQHNGTSEGSGSEHLREGASSGQVLHVRLCTGSTDITTITSQEGQVMWSTGKRGDVVSCQSLLEGAVRYGTP